MVPAILDDPSLKRKRSAITEPKVQVEATRKQVRARLPDGSSKSFKYKDEADKVMALRAAEEYIGVWQPRRTET